jgi:hypothetical protein
LRKTGSNGPGRIPFVVITTVSGRRNRRGAGSESRNRGIDRLPAADADTDTNTERASCSVDGVVFRTDGTNTPFDRPAGAHAMVDHISRKQVEAWLDEKVVQDVEQVSENESEFNVQFRLSRLPMHVIKEETWGPLRLVGKSGFDTDRTVAIIEDDDRRRELLAQIGPVLAATPGFYTFLDAEGTVCEFANVRSIQFEHRLYPDGASQHALMRGLMALATAMRYVQNAVAEVRGDEHGRGVSTEGTTDPEARDDTEADPDADA